MTLRTAILAYDPQQPFAGHIYRQWPGQWPCGNSLVGKTFFVPAAGQELRADWLICPTPAPEMMNTSVPRHRRIFLVMEPPEYWQPPLDLLNQFGWVVSPYPIPGFTGVQIPGVTSGLVWWYGIRMDGHRPMGGHLNWDAIAAEPAPTKLPLASTITSNKAFLPGHRARLEFTATLKEAMGDRLQLFGHGFNPVQDKRDALLPFQYHVAIENAVHPHFWTEKLADPLLARCKVFYYGATEVAQYFSPDSVVAIDIARPRQAIDLILSHMDQGGVNQAEIDASRERVLCAFNLPSFIDRLIDSIEQQEAAAQPLVAGSAGR